MGLLIGGAAVYIVHKECNTPKCHTGKFRFHVIVIAKFFLQDVPQQVCIILYLFGWYESNGLRCQLCLFHPDHCEDEHPFHMSNAIAIGCTLLSSMANQLLVRPVHKKTYTDDDICMQQCMRTCGICVSTLPFTTGMCMASQSLLLAPVVVHIVFAVPCFVGWLTLAGLCCTPFLFCCDEEFP